jgi:hypothetical protein
VWRSIAPHAAACLVAAIITIGTRHGHAAESPPNPPPSIILQPATPASADYKRQLEEYARARQAYEKSAAAYWTLISEKRRQRNAKRRDGQEVSLNDYVLTQPPVYTGPSRPVDSTATPERSPQSPPERKYIPVVADFLHSARDNFDFTPQLPLHEGEFKRAYAQAALAAGLTRNQVVRIYGFESGGNGTYDAQAGLEYPRPGAHAISPALGYNQLLNTNTVELLAEDGEEFVKVLRAKAARASGNAKQALEHKIDVVRRMIEFCRIVPDQWAEHDILANTPRGLGVHALVLDIDIGPLLQAKKLQISVQFARRRGHQGTLTAAELEMMNLTGDGNGLDMVLMPAAMRERVPTANFFQQAGYERNPVAIRNNVVAKLIAATDVKMDKEASLPGARELFAAF